ncbi:hypothetical protein EJB05_10780 [Eragrostis curvula]|uniref:Uncharacterized protein n=1 Tax=Eragrostis curvula TaxID=38414 RepID=A0A5J9VPW2_9POAL|nr:hypothetical protein EJB05_10780 [Eragrostis curvula]
MYYPRKASVRITSGAEQAASSSLQHGFCSPISLLARRRPPEQPHRPLAAPPLRTRRTLVALGLGSLLLRR